MDGNISSNYFHPMKERTEMPLKRVELKLKNLKTNDITFQDLYRSRGSNVGEHCGVLQKSGWKDQKKILGCIFSETRKGNEISLS